MITKAGIVKGNEFNEYLQNMTMVGNVTVNDGIASGFTTSNYFKLPVLKVGLNPWEINVAFMITSYDGGSYAYPIFIINGASYMNEGGVLLQISQTRQVVSYGFQSGINPKWDIGTSYGSTELLINTLYYAKVLFNGTQYVIKLSTDNSTWTTEATINSTKVIQQDDDCVCFIGYRNSLNWAYLNGSIYLKNFTIKVNDKLVYSPALNKTTISKYQTTANNFYEI